MSCTEHAPLAYSVRDACKALSIKKTKLYAIIKEGRLRVVRVGRRTLIPADSLLALLNGEDVA
jgi:excisionase family DNA binding protein